MNDFWDRFLSGYGPTIFGLIWIVGAATGVICIVVFHP